MQSVQLRKSLQRQDPEGLTEKLKQLCSPVQTTHKSTVSSLHDQINERKGSESK